VYGRAVGRTEIHRVLKIVGKSRGNAARKQHRTRCMMELVDCRERMAIYPIISNQSSLKGPVEQMLCSTIILRTFVQEMV